MVTHNLQDIVNKVIRQTIKNISIVMFMILLLVGALAAFGAEFDFQLTSKKFGFLTLLTIISATILYSMWEGNGKNDGEENTSYKKTKKDFFDAVKNLNKDTLSAYLFHEKQRRRKQFEREAMELTGLNEEQLYNLPLKKLRHMRLGLKLGFICFGKMKLINRCRKGRFPKLAFKTAEEIIGMRTLESNGKNGETNTGAEKTFASSNRVQDFLRLIVLACVATSIAFSVSKNTWQSVLTIAIMLVTYITRIARGYNMGYKRIVVFRAGAFATGKDYIDKCEQFAKEKDLKLRVEPDATFLKKIVAEAKAEIIKEIEEETREEEQGA